MSQTSSSSKLHRTDAWSNGSILDCQLLIPGSIPGANDKALLIFHPLLHNSMHLTLFLGLFPGSNIRSMFSFSAHCILQLCPMSFPLHCMLQDQDIATIHTGQNIREVINVGLIPSCDVATLTFDI